MDILLEIENLSKVYKTPKKDITALNGISFRVEEGEFVTVIGPSGCGKSTHSFGVLQVLKSLLEEKSELTAAV